MRHYQSSYPKLTRKKVSLLQVDNNACEVKSNDEYKICCLVHRHSFLEKVKINILNYLLLLNTGLLCSIVNNDQLFAAFKGTSKPLDLITNGSSFDVNKMGKF